MLLLTACGNAPKVPDWQVSAKSATDRFVDAELSGSARAAQAEFVLARRETASTGRPDLVARIELLRCATQVASLDLQPCTGFEALRADAAAPERAYADYLAGRDLAADAVALLPAAQQGMANQGAPGQGGASAASPGADGQSSAPDGRQAAPGAGASVAQIEDPLSRLVAAGVLFQRGAANAAVVQSAVDTASAQGWRRPLLAWLGVQVRQAEAAGQTERAATLRRRMDLVAPAGAGQTLSPASSP
ncbi:hypothetical protein CCO03_10270 [Comamonas serinivorans]|uniref:Uncharacterized protein n=1 Tax=Comamonas serinivorans TaxID=1082851 RepID=A0A1Y0ENK4_9BURK|nr:hypothetical protein [Comamonas serinivorans]ARU05018.1 hypothetical protein CCO03_10270 [Comamonas serinivorans]